MQVSTTDNPLPNALYLQNNEQQVVNVAESKKKTVKPRNYCGKCDKSFSRASCLTRHNKSKKHKNNLQAKKLSCIACPTSFNTKNKLQEHYLTNHESLKPYSCDFCDKSYIFETSLLQHYRKAYNSGASRKIKYYKCDLCDPHLTLNSKGLTAHYKQQHPGKHPFKCNFCDKGFLYSSHANKHHRDIHQGESLLKTTSNQKTVSNNENQTNYQDNDQHKLFELIDDIMPDIKQGSSADDTIFDIEQELNDMEQYLNERMKQDFNERIKQEINEIIK